MLKGEIYAAVALMCFALFLFALGYLGLPWWVCLIISLVPAIYSARKAAKSAEEITDK